MDELIVVRPDPQRQAGSVYFGAWVTLEDESGEIVRYRLVGPDEFDAGAGLISVDSPVARALIGKSVDDEVVVSRPRGRTLYTILDIRYT